VHDAPPKRLRVSVDTYAEDIRIQAVCPVAVQVHFRSLIMSTQSFLFHSMFQIYFSSQVTYTLLSLSLTDSGHDHYLKSYMF